MDFRLTEEQRSIVRTVRELTQDKFKPNALKYMDGTFPWDNLRDLAQIGRQNDKGRFPSKLDLLLQLFAQHLAERREQLRTRHAVIASS